MTFEQWALSHFPELDLSKDQTGIYRNKAARDHLAGWEGAKNSLIPEPAKECTPAPGWHWMKGSCGVQPVLVDEDAYCEPTLEHNGFFWIDRANRSFTYIGAIDAPPGA